MEENKKVAPEVDNGLKEAVKKSTKDKYLEKFDEFIETCSKQMKEYTEVVKANTLVREICKRSPEFKKGDKVVLGSIESFDMVIQQSKLAHSKLNMKKKSAIKLRALTLNDGKIPVEMFLTDFDKMAG